MSGQQPAAGWYPDPDDATKQRYWDGSRWTEHRAAATVVGYDQAAQIRATPRKRAFIVLGAVAALVVLVAVVSSMTSDDDTSVTITSTVAPTVASTVKPPPLRKAKFKATVTSARAMNPATFTVFARVKNTGDAAAPARCFVIAQDPSGTYEGYGNFNVPGGAIKPGKEGLLRADLIVTNEGAAWVTDIDVDCKVRS